MTTDRPYRKAMSIDDAVAELLANTGTQFDPRVVDSLLGVLGRVAAPPQVALNVDWAPQR
jgi:HD-GYP domain-containing protein (c-di-GMP phosphodiesterase class II)